MVGLDVVQQVGEELVASLQDAQGNQRVLEVVADVLGETRRPTGEKVFGITNENLVETMYYIFGHSFFMYFCVDSYA